MILHIPRRALIGLLLIILLASACGTATPAPTAVAIAFTAATLPATDTPPVETATSTPAPPTNTPTATMVPATETPTATALPPTPTRLQPTSTPRPPTLPPATATKAPGVQMPASYFDGFDSPGLLPSGPGSICTRSYEGGQYHIRVSKQNYMCWANYPREYINFVLEVDVTMYSGEGSCGGGADVIFGSKDQNNFYVFSVSRLCRSYSVSKLVNGQWQTVRPWDRGLRVGDSPQPDVTVAHLKLVVQGTQFELYSGDALMDRTSDPAYQGGRVGLSGGTWGQDTHVSFDNFKIDPLP
jgi:hypothetical protein